MRFLPFCPGVQKNRQSSGPKGPGEVVEARCCCVQQRFINRVPARHPFTDGGDYGTAQTVSIGAAQAASKSRT